MGTCSRGALPGDGGVPSDWHGRVTGTDADDRLRTLGAAQHGVIRRDDARAAGLTDRQIRRRIERGDWSRHSAQVFLISSTPPGPEQPLLAAAWSVSGAGSHPSAAWALGILDDPPDRPHVSTTFDRGRALQHETVVIHRPDHLTAVDLTRRHGIPVTSVERTLCDLGATVDLDTLRECAERALRLRLTHPDRLIRRHLQIGGRGHPGSAAARVVLGELESDLMLVESDLESLLLRLLDRAGLPRPALQHPVSADSRVYRLDMAYPELRIALEADGFATHGTMGAFENDRARRNALTLAGWTVLQFTWRQICARPEWVVAQVKAALDRATRSGSPVRKSHKASPFHRRSGRRGEARRWIYCASWSTRERRARPRWEISCFSAADIWAKVRPSPSVGTKTGS